MSLSNVPIGLPLRSVMCWITSSLRYVNIFFVLTAERAFADDGLALFWWLAS